MLILAFSAMTASASDLPKGQWKLTGYNFRQKIAFPIDKMNVTLNIEDGRLGGRSGCNVYGGDLSFEEEKLKIGGLISTMMACDEMVMQFERTYTQTLQNATDFTLSGDELVLTDPKTASFLKFEKVTVPPFRCGTKPPTK